MGLNETDRKNLVNYKLERAKEIFSEIPILLENEFYGNAASRLYYACYNAASALLINDGHRADTHSGVKSLLNHLYIKDNKIDKSYSKMYTRFLDLRQDADYGIWVNIEKSDVEYLIEPAKQFILSVEKLISKNQQNEQDSQIHNKNPKTTNPLNEEEMPRMLNFNGVIVPNPKHPENLKKGRRL